MKFKVRVTEEESRTTVFAERGVWNRLGAYVVHIGLLTIFFGGFMTSRGFTGMMPIADRKSTRLNSSHLVISYGVFCLKKKNIESLSGHPAPGSSPRPPTKCCSGPAM